MNQSIRIWQWPNVLALDAALIALLSQQVFARATGADPGIGATIVLPLAVCG